MNIEIEKTPAFALENKNVKKFIDLQALGLYTYIKMLKEHETTELSVIVERAAEHFSVDENDILNIIKQISDLGVLFVKREE